jgi:hypothetical protein
LSREVVQIRESSPMRLRDDGGSADLGARASSRCQCCVEGNPIRRHRHLRRELGSFPRSKWRCSDVRDQAVIAVENVRLFKELEARNAELTESLDRQTATAEILRVISGSRTDVQPVFDAIVQSAVRPAGRSTA